MFCPGPLPFFGFWCEVSTFRNLCRIRIRFGCVMSGVLCRIPADVWLSWRVSWHLVCRRAGVRVLVPALCRAGARAGVVSNRVSCVCYDLVSCVCYDSVRMYVIMYDMIRYVRNTIHSCMTELCALCGIITYEYVYDMTLTRTNMRYVALCYVYDSCGIPRLPYVYVYDSCMIPFPSPIRTIRNTITCGATRSVYSTYKTNTKCI